MADWNFEGGSSIRTCENDRDYYQHQLDCFKALEQKNQEEKEKWEKNGRKGKYPQYALKKIVYTTNDGVSQDLNYAPLKTNYYIDLFQEILSKEVIEHPSMKSLALRGNPLTNAVLSTPLIELDTPNLRSKKGLPSGPGSLQSISPTTASLSMPELNLSSATASKSSTPASNVINALNSSASQPSTKSSLISLDSKQADTESNVLQVLNSSINQLSTEASLTPLNPKQADTESNVHEITSGSSTMSMTLKASDHPSDEDARAFWDTARSFASPKRSGKTLFSPDGPIQVPEGVTIYPSAEAALNTGKLSFTDSGNEKAFIIFTDGNEKYWLGPTKEGTKENVQITMGDQDGIIAAIVHSHIGDTPSEQDQQTANNILAYNQQRYDIHEGGVFAFDMNTGQTHFFSPADNLQHVNDGIFNGLDDLSITTESGLATLAGQSVRGRYKDGQITIDDSLMGSDADLMGVVAEEYGEHMVDQTNAADNPTEDTGAIIGRRLMHKLINEAEASPDGLARLTVSINGNKRTLEATPDELRSVLGSHFTTERIKNPVQDEAGSYQLEGALEHAGENWMQGKSPFHDIGPYDIPLAFLTLALQAVSPIVKNPPGTPPTVGDMVVRGAVIGYLKAKQQGIKMGMAVRNDGTTFELTPINAFLHWLFGQGTPLRVNFRDSMAGAKKENGISVDQFKDFYYILAQGEGLYHVKNIKLPVSTKGDRALVFGNVTWKFTGELNVGKDSWTANGEYRCFHDKYDFNPSYHRPPQTEIGIRGIYYLINGVDYMLEFTGGEWLLLKEKGQINQTKLKEAKLLTAPENDDTEFYRMYMPKGPIPSNLTKD